MKKKIAILGGGSMGTALTKMLAQAGHKVALYSIEPEVIAEIKERNSNSNYLPGIILPNNFEISDDLEKVIRHSHYILFAVPSQEVRKLAVQVKALIKTTMTIINLAKGLEQLSHNRLSRVANEELGKINYCCLTGPSHAEEIAQDMPTTVVAASENIDTARNAQKLLTTPHFRIYTTTDLIGAELGGALKNPLAIGAGTISGIGFGDNSKVALIMRGLEEMVRLAVKLGAREKTIRGLAGMGDLIVTCISNYGRNYKAGQFIGQGIPVETALKKVGMVVEGYATCPVVCDLADLHQVEMPIFRQVYQILYKDKSPHKAVRELMMRDLKNEFD